MTIKTLLIFFLLGILPLGSKFAALGQSQSYRIQEELSVDGPALFYVVHKGSREEVWSVSCALPLRGCVARTAGLVLSIDSEFRPWILTMKSPASRVLIQTKNYMSHAPKLTSSSLDSNEIQLLSGPHSFVVVEDAKGRVSRMRTTGLSHVISYLKWLQSDNARALKDARLWPDLEGVKPATQALIGLSWHGRQQMEPDQIEKQLVPNTKPQIEFALRSQKGESYFSPTGHAGY